jgi:hypothetical protein
VRIGLPAVAATALLLAAVPAPAEQPKGDAKPPANLKYLWATAYHIPPETTTEESGYFALCEGKDGKIYIGTAAYGRNSYLVEFDPKTEKMRIVVDSHKVLGLPLEPTGYAAQSKIHTRNYVGPSGIIYMGTKQGYPTAEEKKSGKVATYRGGYVMTYDPSTGKAENLGMPMPLGDKRLPADATEGEGVIDVTADEQRGLLYVVTCEHQNWMLYDKKYPEKGYRALGPILRDQPNTLVDKKGRGTAITKDYEVARYDPATDKVTVDKLLVDGKPFADVVGPKAVHPDWRLAADGKTAYLQLLNDLRLFEVDLGGDVGKPVVAKSLGNRIEGKHPDSRGSVAIANDGRVYSAIRIDNETKFGAGYLHHIVRYDPADKKIADLGVITIKNPNFFDFKGPHQKNADGSLRPRHGFHTLPDGTLTPLHVILGTIVAKDGTIYSTVLAPYTLVRIPPVK